MNEHDFIFVPHSSARLRSKETADQHKKLFKAGNPAGAARLLKNHPHLEAFTASIFNFLEQKLVSFKKQEIFNVYSDTEPTAEEMAGKVFWNKEY